MAILPSRQPLTCHFVLTMYHAPTKSLGQRSRGSAQSHRYWHGLCCPETDFTVSVNHSWFCATESNDAALGWQAESCKWPLQRPPMATFKSGLWKAAEGAIQHSFILGSHRYSWVQVNYLSNGTNIETKAEGFKISYLSYREMEKLLQRIMDMTGQHTFVSKAWNALNCCPTDLVMHKEQESFVASSNLMYWSVSHLWRLKGSNNQHDRYLLSALVQQTSKQTQTDLTLFSEASSHQGFTTVGVQVHSYQYYPQSHPMAGGKFYFP